MVFHCRVVGREKLPRCFGHLTNAIELPSLKTAALVLSSRSMDGIIHAERKSGVSRE
jgi:hypothetical protein